MLKSVAQEPSALSHAEGLLMLCKAAGDSLRQRVLRVLSRDAFSVQELCDILDVSQPGLSHHLRLLARNGLVTTRREGNNIYYRRASQPLLASLAELQSELLRSSDDVVLDEGTSARLNSVKAQRAEQSQHYFAEHGAQFAAQQEQMVPYSLYGQACYELLSEAEVGTGLAIEIGPGEGAFLPLLASRFDQVIGLDNSATMLEKAEAKHQAENIRFVLGDTRSKKLKQGAADCVVMNMVLHHVASPAELFEDAAALLKDGGLLCITDLCRHDQNWAREACGDLWLGFEPDDLSNWAEAAKLSEGASAYLAQRNGFQVQLRQFRKG